MLPQSAFPNCENPQVILTPVSLRSDDRAPVARPCGHCYSCRARRSQIKAGQISAEIARPFFEDHARPDGIIFVTFTYADWALPMTQPVAHDLALSWDQEGPFTGPFVRVEGEDRPAVIDGVPYARSGGRILEPLTPRQCEWWHRRYLDVGLGWSPDQVTEWVSGRYESTGTLRFDDMTSFMWRLRDYHRRHFPELSPLRFGLTGEYGDLRHRPHYHLILLGWSSEPRATEFLYRAWKDTHGDSMVHPDLMAALHGNALPIQPGTAAARYQAKDLVKSRSAHRVTPAMAARELPQVRQSTRPPLGAAFLPEWLESTILPAMLGAGDDDLGQCLAARQAYTQMVVTSGVAAERFTTSDYFRRAVQDLFDQDVWDWATVTLAREAAGAQALDDPHAEGGFHEHREAVRAKNRVHEGRAKRLKRAKALRRLSAGMGLGESL